MNTTIASESVISPEVVCQSWTQPVPSGSAGGDPMTWKVKSGCFFSFMAAGRSAKGVELERVISANEYKGMKFVKSEKGEDAFI